MGQFGIQLRLLRGHLLAVSILLCVTASLAGQDEVIRVDTNLVSIPVSVTEFAGIVRFSEGHGMSQNGKCHLKCHLFGSELDGMRWKETRRGACRSRGRVRGQGVRRRRGVERSIGQYVAIGKEQDTRTASRFSA